MTNHNQREQQEVAQQPTKRGLLFMSGAALFVGVVAGWGAIVFRALIGLFHNALFLGEFSLSYDANVHTPAGPWGSWIILVPVVGAIGVAYLVKTFAPEAKGHGVPEVMDAIYYNEGRIRPIVAVIKALASALSIGSGGSIGREGPIIQIGAAFGAALGQWIHMPAFQRVTLVAAGAAGGIAATFNTPIGGLMFAIELLLPAINSATLLPVAISTVTATCVSRYVLSVQPAFNIPELQIPTPHAMSFAAYPLFIVFGLLIGLLATLFVRSIYWTEDQFEKMPGNYYTRHMSGMLLVGLIMLAFMKYGGHYFVQGVGYATIEDVLRQSITSPFFLLVLLAAKLIVTNVTLGSGASGGVFSPALFLGAVCGGAIGGVVSQLFPDLGIGETTFAVVGMAGMIAGSTGAVVTAITMLFEMTRDYNAILPIMLTVAIAYMVRKSLSPGSIYTLKLVRRGHLVPEELHAAFDSDQLANQVMTREFATHAIEPNETPGASERPASGVALEPNPDSIAIKYNEHLVLIPGPTADETDATTSPQTACRLSPRYVVVGEHDSLDQIISALERCQAEIAVVSRDPKSTDINDIVGVITMQQLLATLKSSWKLFG